MEKTEHKFLTLKETNEQNKNTYRKKKWVILGLLLALHQ